MPYVSSTCPRDHVRTCQKRANCSFSRAKVPNFQLGVSAFQMMCWFFLLFFKIIIFFNILNIFIPNIFYTLYKHIICILQHRRFPVSITKFLRAVFLKEHSQWLVLPFTHYSTRKHSQKKREETWSKKVFLWLSGISNSSRLQIMKITIFFRILYLHLCLVVLVVENLGKSCYL